MTEMFPVQMGVPIPAVVRSRPKRAVPRKKYPVETMKVGGMFFIPGRTVRRVSAYISRITKNLPGKFVTRAAVMVKNDNSWVPCEAGTPGATEGVGVWRTE